MFLCLPCVILWAQPCFLLERVRKIDRSSNVDQEQVRKVSPVCMWGYDLTADQGSEEGQLHPMKTGSLRIELQFAQTLAAVINVIVFAEFDNQIEINSLGEIVTDY